MATKKEVLREHLKNYLKASREEKGALLDRLTAVLSMRRKAVTRALRREQWRDPGYQERRGRPTTYGPDVTAALKDVWGAASNICGELLHPMIPEYVAVLRRDGLWRAGQTTTQKLLAMSAATVKRRVAAFAREERIRQGRGTTRASPLLDIIPLVVGEWAGKPPGYGHVDTVAHCSASLVGDFVYTVNYTDLATLWVIPRAQWNKGQQGTTASLAAIQHQLPVTLRGLHPDTGSEFINWHLQGWCAAQVPPVLLARSRPYHKNDNAYVEQKNGHVVRRFVGYARLDVRAIVPLLNDYYAVLAVYLNHFVPSRKCQKKVRVGSRYRRQYDRAQTPYQRMLAHVDVPAAAKRRLEKEHTTLNPLLLKQHADRLREKVFYHQKHYGSDRFSR